MGKYMQIPDGYLEYAELVQRAQAMTDALKTADIQAANILFSFQSHPSFPDGTGWNDIQSAKVATIGTAAQDASNIGELCRQFDQCMADVLDENAELAQIDLVWQMFGKLSSFTPQHPGLFDSYLATVLKITSNYSNYFANNPTPGNLASKKLVDAYPSLVTDAIEKCEFLKIMASLEADAAALALWTKIRDDDREALRKEMPPILQCRRKQGCCIYTAYNDVLSNINIGMPH